MTGPMFFTVRKTVHTWKAIPQTIYSNGKYGLFGSNEISSAVSYPGQILTKEGMKTLEVN